MPELTGLSSCAPCVARFWWRQPYCLPDTSLTERIWTFLQLCSMYYHISRSGQCIKHDDQWKHPNHTSGEINVLLFQEEVWLRFSADHHCLRTFLKSFLILESSVLYNGKELAEYLSSTFQHFRRSHTYTQDCKAVCRQRRKVTMRDFAFGLLVDEDTAFLTIGFQLTQSVLSGPSSFGYWRFAVFLATVPVSSCLGIGK